jgi:hypothetical protein
VIEHGLQGQIVTLPARADGADEELAARAATATSAKSVNAAMICILRRAESLLLRNIAQVGKQSQSKMNDLDVVVVLGPHPLIILVPTREHTASGLSIAAVAGSEHLPRSGPPTCRMRQRKSVGLAVSSNLIFPSTMVLHQKRARDDCTERQCGTARTARPSRPARPKGSDLTSGTVLLSKHSGQQGQA